MLTYPVGFFGGGNRNPLFAIDGYTGTGASNARVLNPNFQPDLIWEMETNFIMNSLSGAGKYFVAQGTAAEASEAGTVTSFNSNGYTLGSGSSINTSATDYQSFAWKISSAFGFDLQPFTGNGGTVTVNHNLGQTPRFMFRRNLTTGSATRMYHCFFDNGNGVNPEDYYVDLSNTTDMAILNSATWGAGSNPSSTQVDVGGTVNTDTYLLALFGDIPGYSKVDWYVGNGSTSGNVVITGFRPRFLLVRPVNATGGGFTAIIDATKNPSNPRNGIWNVSNATYTTAYNGFDFLSNGFQCIDTNPQFNENGKAYAYLAIA